MKQIIELNSSFPEINWNIWVICAKQSKTEAYFDGNSKFGTNFWRNNVFVVWNPIFGLLTNTINANLIATIV